MCTNKIETSFYIVPRAMEFPFSLFFCRVSRETYRIRYIMCGHSSVTTIELQNEFSH